MEKRAVVMAFFQQGKSHNKIYNLLDKKKYPDNLSNIPSIDTWRLVVSMTEKEQENHVLLEKKKRLKKWGQLSNEIPIDHKEN